MDDYTKFVAVASFPSVMESYIIQSMLAAEEIETSLEGEHASTALPLL